MKTDKNIEEFAKKLIKDAQLESPSSNFVNKVMDAIELETKRVKIKGYKPLISKWGWLIILLVVSFLCYFMLTGTPQSSTLLAKYSSKFIDIIKAINIFEGIQLSKMFTFSFVFFSALVVLQIFVIKNYFNKQYTV